MPAKIIKSISKIPKGLTVLTAPTPNGYKPTIYMELLKLSYHVKSIDVITERETDKAWYKKYNPPGKIPTLLISNEGEKVDQSIFESSCILYYLADNFDKDYKYHYPMGHPLHYEELSWSFFQRGALGPTQGQANHFNTFAKETHSYAIQRYCEKANHYYDVMELHLQKQPFKEKFFVGDKLGISDVLIWPWVRTRKFAAIDLINRPALKEWYERLNEMDAFKKGTSIV